MIVTVDTMLWDRAILAKNQPLNFDRLVLRAVISAAAATAPTGVVF
jgi:hypothetical protein